MCTEPGETFTLELEWDERQRIDIVCSIGDTIAAAIELKCFGERSNRASDLDMYDVYRDIERLLALERFPVKRFICLTDSVYYFFQR